ILNEQEFITEVVRLNTAFGSCPGYICKYGEIQSEICESATVAISTVYQRVFNTKTKFLGPEVLGFDKAIIMDELLSDLLFHPYIQLGNLQIWIINIESSSEISTNLAEIEKNHCKVTIFYGSNVYINFIDQSPDLVWIQIGILRQYNGDQLFGLTNQHTKDLVQTAQIPKQPNNIIELRLALQQIYPTEYEIGVQEFRAWKAILKNVGCSDVTPYEKDQSKVSNDLICAARKHARIYGPGGLVTKKPVVRHEKMAEEKKKFTTTVFSDGQSQPRDVLGMGEWKIFTIAELDKLRKKDINRPALQVSAHTVQSSEWEMLIPNLSQTKEQLITLLESHLAEDVKNARI
ncbi:15634_t:CDS:2, partial [Gigaspora rosea]